MTVRTGLANGSEVRPQQVICAWCGSIQTTFGDWIRGTAPQPVDGKPVSHGMCPDCAAFIDQALKRKSATAAD